jgi:peptidoglycan/LPS O-acetylase OafA/YrhL
MAGAAIVSFERAGALRVPRAQPLLGFAGLAAITLSARLLEQSSLFPGWWVLAPVVGAALVIVAPEEGLCGRLLGFKPMRWIGRISYPLYLWHWPMLSFAAIECTPAWPSRPLRLALVAAAIVLADLTTRFVEQPIRARRDRITIAVLIALMAAAGMLGLAIFHAGAGCCARSRLALPRRACSGSPQASSSAAALPISPSPIRPIWPRLADDRAGVSDPTRATLEFAR